MLKGLLPGTFNPPTLGHIKLIARAAKLYDHLIVGIGNNSAKTQKVLSVEEIIECLKKETSALKNVEILPFSGLVTTFAKEQGAHVLIRGLRSFNDFEYEMQLALANCQLSGIETVFLMSEFGMSSSLIRELAQHGAPLQGFVPQNIENTLHKYMQKEKLAR